MLWLRQSILGALYGSAGPRAGAVTAVPGAPARKAGPAIMNEQERANLVDDLVSRLRVEGAPAGTWLIDIGRVRSALRDADSLLFRLQEAIVEGASHADKLDA